MHSTLRPYVTAGAVIVGAGLIAAIPMAAPVPHINTVRDVALTAGPSEDAFTVGNFTFDPGQDGFTPIYPLIQLSPLMEIGGGSLSGTLTGPGIAPQTLTVYSGDGTDLGTVNTNVSVQDLLGIDSTQLIVTGSTPADGVDADQLPADGAVYSITNLGGGIDNVYQAIPGSDGGAANITDTLVTPLGNLDLSSLFGGYDASQLLNPDDALAGLAVADAGTGGLSDNAFTVGGFTFDPGSDGFQDANPLFGIAPLLNLGGGSIVSNGLVLPERTQDLSVYGSDDTDLGSVNTIVNTSNILGIDSTQLTVAEVTPADGVDAGQLPADGTVYSVSSLGNGIENVYQAIPGSDGGAANITDTLVTPFGNTDLSFLFGNYDATQKLDPGDALSGLAAAAGGPGDLSDNAFTLGGFTFDPGSSGFIERTPLFGIAPLLEVGGGRLFAGFPLAQQELDVYGNGGTDLGTVETNVNISNILGIDTTQLNILGSTPADGVDADQLPADGTVYSVTDFGGGYENVYEAIPNAAGTSAATITDTLVTPFGNVDLSTMFDAIAALDPGDAAAGVSTSAASGFDLFDPSTWF